ncbi:hypothetical protein [Streptomyces sp. NPDC091371]|uniref:hypothetical protein n=1 Tax=Streptomyces sp. NPDC091371 TaxID=3155303 RepID=UPI00342EEC42
MPRSPAGGDPQGAELGTRPPRIAARPARLIGDRYSATLPGRLRLARAVCVLLVAGLLILLAVAATGAATTWDETALRNAPRTISATQLNLALNDMDAQTANILLSSGDSGTGKGRLDESYTKAGGAREDYRAATDLLAQRLLPEARKLVDANNAVYERQYAAARADLVVQRTAEAVLGVLLIAATLCAVLAVVCGAQLLTITYDRMKVARRDSFDYDANADESRYLLDPDRRTRHVRPGARRHLGHVPEEPRGQAVHRRVPARTGQHHLRRRAGSRREDRRGVRRLPARRPRFPAAGSGEWMKALDQVTAINQPHFDLAVQEGRGALTTQAPTAGAALLLTAGLTVLGLRRRLAEFR